MVLFGMPGLPVPLKRAFFYFLFEGLTPWLFTFNLSGFRNREVQSLRFDCVAPLGVGCS